MSGQSDGSARKRGADGGERRAALVTGAASGIGRAIAHRLARDGIQLLAVDRKPDPSGPGVPFQADLVDRAANDAAVDEAVRRFGRLDIVVCAAGLQHVAPIEEFPDERWDELLAVMLTSPFLIARRAWPLLRESEAPRFIVIGSIHSLVASPFKSAYVSAKHGALGLVRTLAVEGAPHGIVTAAVCPTYVRTPLVERQIADQARAHGIAEQAVVSDVLLKRQAVKRLIEPEEVADAVAFLLGPAGRSFTGTALTMDQGWSAH
jgi:3-hydroxybutyrate dehydrogenase